MARLKNIEELVAAVGDSKNLISCARAGFARDFSSSALALHDLDLKSHRQLLGWIAGGIVTSLILQKSVDGIRGGQYVVQWPHGYSNFKVSAVNAQLIVGRKWKAAVLAGWIDDSADH